MTETITTTEAAYEVIRPIGSGGMGQILLVRSPRQPEPVALKFLQAQWMNETRIEGFKREFALLSELRHPHLCKAYDFGFAPSHNQCFFTCEFIEGEQLGTAMKGAPLEEMEIALAQILSALDFLHFAGLVHFDVKGDNVLVRRLPDGRPHATLVDLGVTSPANKKLTEIAGTLHYIAPELLLPDPAADGRCDLYSFGVMCYALLAGQLPYLFSSFEDVWIWHRLHPNLDIEPLKRRGVPDYLCQMIAKLMRPTPSERFSRAGVALDYLNLHSCAPRSDLPTIQRAQISEGPFVGRVSLMATIKNSFKAAKRAVTNEADSDQRVFIIGGREGMGKTRLLRELKYMAQLTDFTVKMYDSERHGTSWESFTQTFDIGETKTADDAQRLLIEEAGKRPLCICCDNLHLSAKSVQQCIYGLMGTIYSAALTKESPPIVCVATIEPGQGPASAGGASAVELTPLSEGEVRGYLEQLVGMPEDFDAFFKAVWEFSGGVPLLMVEASRNYHRDIPLPASIEDLYDDEIASLSPTAREMLALLAFAGRPLPYAFLDKCFGDAAQKEISLISAALVKQDKDNDSYSLATGALATAVQPELTDAFKKKYADRLIDLVLALPAATALDASAYAQFSADPARTTAVLSEAAQQAQTAGDSRRAISLWRTLATIYKAFGQTEDALAARRKTATLQLYLGEHDDCRKTIDSLIKTTGKPRAEELKMLGLLSRVRRKPKEAVEHYEKALAILKEDEKDPDYLFLKNEYALAIMESGDPARAAKLFGENNEMADKLPEELGKKVTNNNLGAALSQMSRFDDAIKFYRDKLARFSHDKRLQGSVYSQLAVVQLRAGLTDDAIASFEQAWSTANQTGDMHNALPIMENLIALLQKKAAYTTALTHAKKSLALRSVGANERDVGHSMMTIATLYLNVGVPDLAAHHLIQAMRIARRCKDYHLRGWVHINLGYLHKDLGRMIEALNDFEETISLGNENNDRDLARWGHYGAADVLLDHGALQEAKEHLVLLEPMIASVSDPEFQARYELVTRRLMVLRGPTPSTELASELDNLSAKCGASGLLEIQWEVEYLLGIIFQKRREIEPAKLHLRKAASINEALANGLSEEYRQGFLAHRLRSRVFLELEAAEHGEVYVTNVTSAGGARPPNEAAKKQEGTAVLKQEGTSVIDRGRGE